MDTNVAATKNAVKNAIFSAVWNFKIRWFLARAVPGVIVYVLEFMTASCVSGMLEAMEERSLWMPHAHPGTHRVAVIFLIGITCLLPVCWLFVIRQWFLLFRDIYLWFALSSATTPLNIDGLPSAETIAGMQTYHEWLNMVCRYAYRENNLLFQWLLDTKGFRGYDVQSRKLD